jgi:hypothetical protein
MKRRQHRFELTDDQHLILGILLVILVAVSMLYCLGLGGLLLRDAWQGTVPALNGTQGPAEELEATPAELAPPPTDPAIP